MNVRTTMARLAPSETRQAVLAPEQVKHLKMGVRVVLVFGILVSVSANVIHSLTRPDLASMPEWQMWAGLVFAALAPVILFATTEMVTRIPVHSRVLGTVRLAITLAIAGFSAWISYWHMEGVATMLGETGGAQYIYPLIIDGMMLVATISLIELGRLGAHVSKIVEAEAAAAAAGRKCEPGCTCNRHSPKKAAPAAPVAAVAAKPTRSRRTVTKPAPVPTSGAGVGAAV